MKDTSMNISLQNKNKYFRALCVVGIGFLRNIHKCIVAIQHKHLISAIQINNI